MSTRPTTYLLAFDSFKGCMSSAEANRPAAQAIMRLQPKARVKRLTMSDGGDGMLQAFAQATSGRIIVADTVDALLRPVRAHLAIAADGHTAIIESAEACGLARLRAEELDPMRTTSYGLGMLMNQAVREGARRIIVGLGGTATCDCGVGMLQSVGCGLLGEGGILLAAGTRSPAEVISIDPTEMRKRFDGIEIIIAADVDAPLTGPMGAAHVFAPQKGAKQNDVEQLEQNARHFRQVVATATGHDMADRPGAGAAGGIGFALMSLLGADTMPGAELLMSLYNFDKLLEDTDIVMTGEGHTDRQTLMGKLPLRVLKHAQKSGAKTWLLSGRIDNPAAMRQAGFAHARSITPASAPLQTATHADTARHNLRRSVSRLLRSKP